jgi:hypothetical protein
MKLKIKAVSLEQLLIGTLLTSIFMLLLFQTYILTKKHLLKSERKISIIHAKTVANFFLNNIIKNAGYKGPISSIFLPEQSSINLKHNTYIVPKAPIASCIATVNACKNFVNYKILNKITSQKIKPNSNIIIAYDIPEHITVLKNSMTENNSHLKIKPYINNEQLQTGDHMIIADYNNIQRFILSNIYQNDTLIHDPPYNTTSNFVKNFEQGAEIFRVKNIAFYIAKQYGTKSPSYSLYMEDFSLTYRAEAILDEVENLWINDNLATESAHGWIFNKHILINILLNHKLNNQLITIKSIVKNAQE